MRKIIVIGVIISFLLPSHASAQIDNRCWTKSKCESYREETLQLDISQISAGFDDSAEAQAVCGASDAAENPLGFCLAAGKATTKITFGTRNTFEHFGDFIQYIYRYSFIIGSIVAVVMIMLGGFMWVVSGASPDLKQKAQKRIGGAIMGMILLALSYTILNLVNPYLVNLRMPSVWLINPEGLQPPYCSQINQGGTGSTKTMLAMAYPAAQKDTINRDQLVASYKRITSFPQEADTAPCGNYYFVENTSAQTCMGTWCKDKQICVPFTIGPDGKKTPAGECSAGQLILHFKVSSTWTELLSNTSWLGQEAGTVFVSSLEKEWLDDFISFIAVCKKGDMLYQGNYEQWQNEGSALYSKRRIETDSVPEYLMIINKLAGEGSKFWAGSSKMTFDKEWCDDKGEVIGFWPYLEAKLMTKIIKDGRFFIGQHQQSQQTIVGVWEDVGWNNYIPIENIEKGMMLEITLTQTAIDKVHDKKGSWPPSSSKEYTGLTEVGWEEKRDTL